MSKSDSAFVQAQNQKLWSLPAILLYLPSFSLHYVHWSLLHHGFIPVIKYDSWICMYTFRVKRAPVRALNLSRLLRWVLDWEHVVFWWSKKLGGGGDGDAREEEEEEESPTPL